MLVDQSVRDFLAATASRAPTPGGGSVAALVGALGAALHLMIGRYCEGLPEGPEPDVLADGRRGLESLARCIDLDAQSYDAVVRARALPKGTDEEKKARQRAMQSALQGAARAPLETVSECAGILALLDRWARDVKPDFRSDMEASVHCLRAAVAGAAANVAINLPYIKDEAFVRECSVRLKDLVARAEAMAADLLRPRT